MTRLCRHRLTDLAEAEWAEELEDDRRLLVLILDHLQRAEVIPAEACALALDAFEEKGFSAALLVFGPLVWVTPGAS